MNLETLKNTYAQEHGYKSWSEIMFLNNRNPIAVEIHMNEICICSQKAALEKAAENACNCLELYNSEYKLLEQSITDEKILVR